MDLLSKIVLLVALAASVLGQQISLGPIMRPITTTDGYQATWLVDFSGTAGDLVTTNILDSSTHGTTGANRWLYMDGVTSITHTRLIGTNLPTRFSPLIISGIPYQTATKVLAFDAVERAGGAYEGYDLDFTGVNVSNYSVTSLVQFNNVNAGDYNNTDFFAINGNTTFFATAQNLVWTDAFINQVKAHGQTNGGASTLGAGVSVTTNRWYIVTARYNTGDQRVEIAVVDNDTGILIGESISGLGSGTTSMYYLRFSDYLHDPDSGEMREALLAGDQTGGYPLVNLTIPAPITSLTQEIINELHLTWTGTTQRYLIEKQSNGGGWVNLFNPYYDPDNGGYSFEYDDTAVTNGSTYAYRISPLIGNGSYGTNDVTDSVTVDNSPFPVVVDDFAGLGSGSNLDTRVNWGGFANGFEGRTGPSIISISGTGLNFWDGMTPDPDMMTEIEVVNNDFGCGGPAVRCQSGSSTCYAIGASFSSGTDLVIVNSGTKTVLQNNSGQAYSAGYKFRVSASGTGSSTRLNGYVDTGSGWTQIFTNVDPGTGNYLDDGSWGVWPNLAGGFNNKIGNFKGYEL